VRVAAVDIGTNSTRLLIAEAGDGGLRWLERRVVVTGLGEGVDAKGLLSEEAIDRTVGVLAAYGNAIRNAGADRTLAVATSATRDALNRDEFLDRAEQVLGLRPEVISGDDEARLSFRGATSGIGRPGPFLVIDPGGGSTEFVFGDGEPIFIQSVDVGSVRITERSLPDRPAGTADLLAASSSVEMMFRDLDLPGEPATVVGVGGTFTSLIAIALDLPYYDRLAVHHSVLGLQALGVLIGRLADLTVEQTAAIPSLDPARAPVLLGGAVVAEAALRRSGRREATISEADILDGIALTLLGGGES
jgi:exopolyphosphatase/guanosine-5'-triphosphate,3'-diphosphate pyrophosphatase